MTDFLKCITPVDGSVYVERPLASDDEIDKALARARAARQSWGRIAVEERCALLERAVDAFVAQGSAIAEEISWQMGRPLRQSPGEIAGFEERARHMLSIAPDCLADLAVEPKEGFTRFVRRVPVGVVFVVAPWNYPYLTAVNSIIPALAAGNAVLLKHSAQTPLCAERFAAAFEQAGLPSGVFQHLHLGHAAALRMIENDSVDFVAFTGSVSAGHAVHAAAAKRFIGVGLELGGKDPAYVRDDVTIEHAIENVVDGAFFNSGQSCCGIERVYVHEAVYDAFVEGAVALVRGFRLGNPMDADTTLGPLVKASAAEHVRSQIAEAVAAGAKPLIDPAHFPADRDGSAYLAPQVLVDVHHGMRVMSEESFGPVVGIMKVDSDAQAVSLMNESEFGLTASVWTNDADAALAIGEQVNTGTWFMNRCDYLDPALAWTGVKNSGHGCTLSRVGYEQLTRPMSFHLRTRL
jgi:acyl-CoA reductase-like NAD-dependent aldehyde dehydrogenase